MAVHHELESDQPWTPDAVGGELDRNRELLAATAGEDRLVAFGLLALAVGLAANSLLGPLVAEVIEYRFSESLVNQGIGLDAVALLGAVPLAVVAAVLVRRGHPAGPVLGFIPSTFAAYMAPQYIIGPDYLALPGNNEQFFVFHLALFILAAAVVVGCWISIDRARLRPATPVADRRRSLVLFGVAAFILLRWVPLLIELVGGDPTSAEYRENPTAFFLIGVLDLGVVLPAILAAGVAARTGAAWARTGIYAAVGWFALVPAAVAAMAITMQLKDDPNASTATTITMTVAAVVFTAGAGLMYRPMFGTEPASRS